MNNIQESGSIHTKTRMRAKGFSYLLGNSSSLKKKLSALLLTLGGKGRGGEDNLFNIDKKKSYMCVRIMFYAFKITTTEIE